MSPMTLGMEPTSPPKSERAFFIVLSLLTFAAGLFICFVSLVWHGVFGGSWLPVIVALIGLIPGLAFIATSIDGSRHPERGLMAMAVVYLAWFISLGFA